MANKVELGGDSLHEEDQGLRSVKLATRNGFPDALSENRSAAAWLLSKRRSLDFHE